MLPIPKTIMLRTVSTVGIKSIYKSMHTSVLAEKAAEYLDIAPNKVFIDMTFGAGGHSKHILKSCENVKLFALDRDPVAYNYAKQLKEEYQDRVIPLLGKFSDLSNHLKQHNIKQNSIDGILFDFGCSSMQFDEPNRGFSVSKNGPLDMRMDKERIKDQITAADILANAEEADLAKIFRVYGEEKAAKKIARAIIDVRSTVLNITTTKQFAELVASVLSTSHRLNKLQKPVHSATKAFQALRIFVNNELNELNYGMILAHRYLKPEGRMVAITFHSLEDTIVKRHINGNLIDGVANPVPLKYCSHSTMHEKEMIQPLIESNWKQLHKHVIVPDEEEVSSNPRSRSAKLRAAVKVK